MESLQAIIDQALQTRVLTYRQQRHLEALLKHQRYSTAELQALQQLRQALAEGRVVSGSDSLVVISQGCQ